MEIWKNFADIKEDEFKNAAQITYKNTEHFNFAFDVLDELARHTPDERAMVYVSANHEEREFTFGEMSRYSSMAANYFVSLGIKKGDRVMLVLKRHYQFWFILNALHKIGAVAVPASFLLTEEDFDYRFRAAGISAVICTGDDGIAERAEKAADRNPQVRLRIMAGSIKHRGWLDFDSEFEKYPNTFIRSAASPGGDDISFMFFTSGTTAYPKMAAHNFKYPLGHIITAKYWQCVKPGGLHFTISDTGWGKALWGKIYGQWMMGAAVFVYDFERFSAADILPMFAKYGITSFCAPPTMYRFFIKEDLTKYDLSTVEHAATAGEAFNPEVYSRFKAATGLSVTEGFGQTETTLIIATLRGMSPKSGSMGKPVPGYNVRLLRPDGSEAAIGENGEIVIDTKNGVPCGLFQGYYNNAALTESVWRNGLYRTGDIAYRDSDGYFYYVGRTDDIIKSSGYKISPVEIENVIMELPYVLECAVTGAADEIRGQIVKATVVLSGRKPNEALKEEIRSYVKRRTAPYKYPRIVEFADELPKTVSGKIRRLELRGEAAEAIRPKAI